VSRVPHPAEWILAAAAAFFLAAGLWLTPEPPPGFQAMQREAGSLRLATWNLGSGGGAPVAAREEHLPAVAEALAQLDANLVALQELADAEQANRLAQLLGDEWSAAVGGSGGVGFLFRDGELRLRGGRARRFLAGTFIPNGNGVAPIALANMHADAWSSDRRNRLLGRVAERLAGERHAILAGDLNLDVDLNKRGDLFTDSQHRDTETYNYIAERLRDAALHGGSTAEPDRRLDYIFFSPNGFRVLQAGPWKGRRVGDMDHDPVVADLVVE